MFWKVFCIVGVLSQCYFGYEIEEGDWKRPSSGVSSEEYDGNLSLLPIPKSSDDDHEKLIVSDELVADDEDDHEDAVLSFTGPVAAKGRVSVAATFGYDSYSSYPALSSTSPLWFPPAFFQQYFFPASPLFGSPMPFTFSNIPLVSMFLPGMGNAAFPGNTLENMLEEDDNKPASGEMYLEIIPVTAKETLLIDSENPAVELLSPEEILYNPVVFLDGNLHGYEILEDNKSLLTAGLKEEPETEGLVFGGFVPASGTITIAAKF